MLRSVLAKLACAYARSGFGGIRASNLHIPSSDSKFEPLSRDEKSLDWLNIHAAGVDELHAHPTRAVWDVIDIATEADYAAKANAYETFMRELLTEN
jgi:hypothetical protein